MILRPAHCQIRLRGLISCPGQLPNQSMLEFHMYSDFSVHMVFMRRPCAKLFSSAFVLPTMGPPCMDSIFHIELISEIDNVFELSHFEHCPQQRPHEHIFLQIHDPVDESQLAEKTRPGLRYYSLSLYILGIYALRVTLLSTRRRAFK